MRRLLLSRLAAHPDFSLVCIEVTDAEDLLRLLATQQVDIAIISLDMLKSNDLLIDAIRNINQSCKLVMYEGSEFRHDRGRMADVYLSTDTQPMVLLDAVRSLIAQKNQ